MPNQIIEREFEYCGYTIFLDVHMNDAHVGKERVVSVYASSDDAKQEFETQTSELIHLKEADVQIKETVDDLFDDINEYLSMFYDEKSKASSALDEIQADIEDGNR